MDANSTEFIAEAQEVIETFSRNLPELEAQSRSGSTDPDLLNAAFRAVHSLKGLAGLFGAQAIGNLSHTLEGSLDALRLGKLDLSREVLDVLFEGVELFGRLLDPAEGSRAKETLLPTFLNKLETLTREKEEQAAGARKEGNLDWIDESIRMQLSEYEEHRLRENLRLDRHLYRIHAAFDILAIDVGIEALKEKLKAHGEVITYLPSVDGFSDDSIELDILFGSSSSYAEVSALLSDESSVSVHMLQPSGADTASASASAPAPVVTPSVTPAVIIPSDVAQATGVIIGAGGSGGGETPPSPPPGEGGDSGGEGGPGAGAEVSLKSLSQTVRVDLRRLDVLMNLVGELGVVQANLQTVLEDMRRLIGTADVSRDLQVQIRDMTRKLALLQQGILDVRMVPIGQVFDKLARVVRKLSRELDKEIRLSISGEETVLDKLIVEELSDPLMHMIRNCMDHGIESPDDRVAIGKPRAGRVDLRAFQKGNRVVIEVEDDGGGMDWRKIRDTAIGRGAAHPGGRRRDMSPQEVHQLDLRAGVHHARPGQSAQRARGGHGRRQDQHLQAQSGMIDVDHGGRARARKLRHHAAGHAGDHPGAGHRERRSDLLHPAQLGARVDHGRDPGDRYGRGPRGHHAARQDAAARAALAHVRSADPDASDAAAARVRRGRRARPAPRRARRRRALGAAGRRDQAARERAAQRARDRGGHGARSQPHRAPARCRTSGRRGNSPGLGRRVVRGPGGLRRVEKFGTMASEQKDLWQALLSSGESIATDEDYEHGYKREVRQDLRQYVAFRVGSEFYAVSIHDVEEITKPFETTLVPRTAEFLLGIGNVRGRIMPVIDLATRLELGSAELGRSARVLIVELNDEPYGLVVDEVRGVVRIPPESMEECPGAIGGARADYIRSLGRHDGDIIIVLELDEVLDPRDFVHHMSGKRGEGSER